MSFTFHVFIKKNVSLETVTEHLVGYTANSLQHFFIRSTSWPWFILIYNFSLLGMKKLKGNKNRSYNITFSHSFATTSTIFLCCQFTILISSLTLFSLAILDLECFLSSIPFICFILFVSKKKKYFPPRNRGQKSEKVKDRQAVVWDILTTLGFCSFDLTLVKIGFQLFYFSPFK